LTVIVLLSVNDTGASLADSTVRAEVSVSALSDAELRAEARRLIAEAFRERTPQVINGDYKVIGGIAAPQKPTEEAVAAKCGEANGEQQEEREG
jgi:hypothetical protein